MNEHSTSTTRHRPTNELDRFGLRLRVAEALLAAHPDEPHLTLTEVGAVLGVSATKAGELFHWHVVKAKGQPLRVPADPVRAHLLASALAGRLRRTGLSADDRELTETLLALIATGLVRLSGGAGRPIQGGAEARR